MLKLQVLTHCEPWKPLRGLPLALLNFINQYNGQYQISQGEHYILKLFFFFSVISIYIPACMKPLGSKFISYCLRNTTLSNVFIVPLYAPEVAGTQGPV